MYAKFFFLLIEGYKQYSTHLYETDSLRLKVGPAFLPDYPELICVRIRNVKKLSKERMPALMIIMCKGKQCTILENKM